MCLRSAIDFFSNWCSQVFREEIPLKTSDLHENGARHKEAAPNYDEGRHTGGIPSGLLFFSIMSVDPGVGFTSLKNLTPFL